jgi:lysophospholipase L1-like esterase
MAITTNFLGSFVFTGSSIIAQWERLPLFFPGIMLLNTAISGSQTQEIYARLDELVIAHRPSAVCYYCGSNDINNAVPAQTIVGNIVKTYETLQRRLDNVQFIFLSIIKAPQKMDRWAVVEDVNAHLSRLSTRLAGFGYIDVNPVFFTGDGSPRMDYYQADQLHLTPRAYVALGEYLAPRVLGVIREQAKGKGRGISCNDGVLRNS